MAIARSVALGTYRSFRHYMVVASQSDATDSWKVCMGAVLKQPARVPAAVHRKKTEVSSGCDKAFTLVSRQISFQLLICTRQLCTTPFLVGETFFYTVEYNTGLPVHFFKTPYSYARHIKCATRQTRQ